MFTSSPLVLLYMQTHGDCIFQFPVSQRYTNVYGLIHGFSSPGFLSILMLHSACTLLLFEEVLLCSPAATAAAAVTAAAAAASRLELSYEEQALHNH